MIKKRVYYVARKSLATNGCYACHDIPGMEDAKPIGPTLTGWGRKNTGELAFGHVVQYLQQLDAVRDKVSRSGGTDRRSTRAPVRPRRRWPQPLPPYFRDELKSQSRIGFIFQKLSEPRSYDFQETQNKKYTARLQMPQFPLDPAQREAVITFVLGLVSDPPTEKFAYVPDERTRGAARRQRSAQQIQLPRLPPCRTRDVAVGLSRRHVRTTVAADDLSVCAPAGR